MRLWWEVARRSFHRHSTYRAATFAGVFTNTVFGFILASIMLAVFEERRDIGGFDAVDAVTFTWVAQGFLAAVGAFGGHLPLADRIKTGEVVVDLYRPADLMLFELAGDIGRAAFQVLIRATVPLAVGGLFFHLRLPSSASTWLLFIASLTIGLVVSFAIRFLVTLTTFWFLDYRAPSQMSTVVTMFLSGFLMPVVFFPDWLETTARALPFVTFVQLPIEVLMGKHTGADLVAVFAAQGAWAVVLLAVSRWALSLATRRVVIQGG
ncbi:MAG TPA: ABC-2 family transporter protein [Acidimicrobiales bacterium]|jgi:ABC-2 type transport system permease protein|nr:ABC-2 family transporter protein [Acidimicrobiales bacterium]